LAGQASSADPEELKDAFKRAAEIAAVVPESMQEAAFHRALDQILGASALAEGRTAAKSPSRQGPRRAASSSDGAESDNASARLIDGINRTAYPEIASASKVLDRALALLRLASRDFNIDGLTAPEIAKVLTEKFRQRTTRQAVTQALGAAHTMADTGRRGRTTVYRIMQPGEDYLDAGGGQSQPTERRAPPSRRGRRRQPKNSQSAGTSRTRSAPKATATPRARGGRRRGPKTVVGELIDEGFFNEPRTMAETQEQLRHKKGMRYTLQDLSPTFVRLLREGRLDRDRNDSGQYEYSSK
jgi:hypothetical protein